MRYIAFGCHCGAYAFLRGLSVDEDNTLRFDAICPKCKTEYVITTSAEEIRAMAAATDTFPVAHEPRFVM